MVDLGLNSRKIRNVGILQNICESNCDHAVSVKTDPLIG